MQKQLIAGILFLGIWIPDFSHATESYIGESLGLDFYSVIDDGHYALLTQMVDLNIEKTPTLGEFGAGCPGIDLIKNASTSRDILNYGNLSAALKENGIDTIPMDSYQALALCLRNQYEKVVAEEDKKLTKLQKLSSIWLYSDGTTENSDYDLIADIDRINTILFSEELKYTGTKNSSSSSFSDFLDGKSPTPLIPKTGSGTDDGGWSGSGTDTGSGWSDGGKSLEDLIGESCTTNNTSIPMEELMDEDFLAELDDALTDGSNWWDGYSRDISGDPVNWSGSDGSGNLTSSSDFYHSEWSCSGIFCIDVRIVPGKTNALGGGKTTSIESLIEKHNAILEPISGTDLSCRVMSNSMGENDRKSAFTLAGLKVYYNTTPQKEKKFKKETTTETEAEALLKIEQCSNASVWLRADPLLANSPIVKSISINSATNTENIYNRFISTSPQWLEESSLWANCMELYMDEGRRVYYDSFMADVKEIEGFSRSITDILTSMINNLTNLDKLPVWCQ